MRQVHREKLRRSAFVPGELAPSNGRHYLTSSFFSFPPCGRQDRKVITHYSRCFMSGREGSPSFPPTKPPNRLIRNRMAPNAHTAPIGPTLAGGTTTSATPSPSTAPNRTRTSARTTPTIKPKTAVSAPCLPPPRRALFAAAYPPTRYERKPEAPEMTITVAVSSPASSGGPASSPYIWWKMMLVRIPTTTATAQPKTTAPHRLPPLAPVVLVSIAQAPSLTIP